MRSSQRCSECGERHEVCPNCKSRKFTPLEANAPLNPTKRVRTFIQEADDGDEATFSNVCWECGWTEDRTITVTVEEHPPEDDD